ncbi:MAG TPA: hypothetical protein VMS56_08390 [Thermoanaerobaculia bacterium]|nr:hypothetical protein [Thermoanaerobaculia bacterium]
MRRSLTLALALLLSLSLAGCKLKNAVDEAAIAADLDQVGTTELLERTSDDQYDPPADGRLTEAQVRMYLKVRDHETKIAQTARKEAEAHAKTAESKGDKSIAGMMSGFKALGSVADMLTADIRAAHELGFNTAEYQWVKEKVLEASGAAFQETMQASLDAMMDQGRAELQKQYDGETDPQTRAALEQMLEQYDEGRSEMQAEQADPAVSHNRKLLAKYESELTAMAAELAKFEQEPGQAEKALREWQQKQGQ